MFALRVCLAVANNPLPYWCVDTGRDIVLQAQKCVPVRRRRAEPGNEDAFGVAGCFIGVVHWHVRNSQYKKAAPGGRTIDAKWTSLYQTTIYHKHR